MESTLMHLMHGAVITAVLYFIMSKLLKQSENVAVTRSVVLGLLITLYMVVFGHGMPKKINSALYVK
jgi:ABC-type branched-subunit amino acid transport system permease subunit